MASHLQRELDLLKRKLLSLSALVEGTLQRAVKALRERDTALAQWVIDVDYEIDQREVEIEEECQKILALHQPVAYDLRYIIAVLKINGELERIGDATVNIAERALFLSSHEQWEGTYDFSTMVEKAQWMLRNSLDALVNGEANLAYAVCAADDEVDALNREVYEFVHKNIRDHPEHLEILLHLLGISRHLERIGDHATNIAEDVIYLIVGEIVRHRSETFHIAQPPPDGEPLPE